MLSHRESCLSTDDGGGLISASEDSQCVNSAWILI